MKSFRGTMLGQLFHLFSHCCINFFHQLWSSDVWAQGASSARSGTQHSYHRFSVLFYLPNADITRISEQRQRGEEFYHHSLL